MFFPMQLPRPWEDRDERVQFANAFECAEIGERIGIAYGWAQEHHFLEEYSHSSAPEVFLGALSQRTKKMRLGHGITLMPPAYNHPARVAERIATLDLISNGRVEWGTGESSSRLELEGFRVNYIEKREMWAEAVREGAKMMSSEPYPGYNGRYLSMPPRNVMPKPVQRPHPPLWVACTKRESIKLAARLGMGALTFAFMDAAEARFWVDEYYETFKQGCTPLGQDVNPKVAVLAGLMCNEDGNIAMRRGLEGQRYFKWALGWYFLHGTHVPGRTRLWEEFRRATVDPMAGLGAIGDPRQACEHFRELESAGVDQVIVLQQAGRYRHEHVCESLELLGKTVLPEFLERHESSELTKQATLAPYIAAALDRVSPIEAADPEPVEAYPALWKERGIDSQLGSKQAPDAALLWRVHAGATRSDHA